MMPKILYKPLLSVVGWFLGLNPEHIHRPKFNDNIQEILHKIVAEKFKDMAWCQSGDNSTESEAQGKRIEEETKQTLEWTTVTRRRNQKKKSNALPTQNDKNQEQKQHNQQDVEGEHIKVSESEENQDDLDLSDDDVGNQVSEEQTIKILETPKIMMVAQRIVHTNRETKETFDTYAMKLQCNRSEFQQVKECLQNFHKFKELCQFIPYDLRSEDTPLFTSCMQQQNQALKTFITIPVFGIDHEAFHYPVKKD